MFWFILWFVLIVGAIIVLLLTGWSTFRKGMTAFDEVTAAQDLLTAVQERYAESPFVGTQSPGPSVGAEREPLVARVQANRARRDQRRKVASRRHARTYRRWKIVNGTADGPIESRHSNL